MSVALIIASLLSASAPVVSDLVSSDHVARDEQALFVVQGGEIQCNISSRDGEAGDLIVNFGNFRRQEYERENGSSGTIDNFDVAMAAEERFEFPRRWRASILGKLPYLRLRPKQGWVGHLIFGNGMKSSPSDSGIIYLWNTRISEGFIGFCEANFSTENVEI